jgi:hypothetical protein
MTTTKAHVAAVADAHCRAIWERSHSDVYGQFAANVAALPDYDAARSDQAARRFRADQVVAAFGDGTVVAGDQIGTEAASFFDVRAQPGWYHREPQATGAHCPECGRAIGRDEQTEEAPDGRTVHARCVRAYRVRTVPYAELDAEAFAYGAQHGLVRCPLCQQPFQIGDALRPGTPAGYVHAHCADWRRW